MVKPLLVSLTLSLLSLNSFASLKGSWTGYGEWTFQGSGTHCNPMTLKFDETKDKVKRLGGYFDCGLVALDLPDQTFLRKDGLLYLEDKEVGFVDGNHYQWTEQYNENVKVQNDIRVDGRHFDYLERWIEKDGSTLYLIKGRFFLK